MKSRRSSDRRRDPEPQPEFLIDRSLSQVSLPAVLREAGLIVHTLAEIYGEKHAQAVEDTEWIALAAERDLVVFCKDDHIRRRPAERQALLDGNVRVFCLTNARLNFAEQASYFVSNRFRILQACRKPGPYVYGIYQDRITRLWPDDK
jgi:hypothetical protein